MILTLKQKGEIANSKEMMALYRTLTSVQSVASKRIKDYIAEGSNVETILPRIQGLADSLNTSYQSLLDSNTCPTGQHWDAALGECVPD